MIRAAGGSFERSRLSAQSVACFHLLTFKESLDRYLYFKNRKGDNALKQPILLTPRYPKTGFLKEVETISLMIPDPGRMGIYTYGWPKNQKRCFILSYSSELVSL